MTSSQADAAPLNLALTELRLPTIKALWPRFAEQADKEGWPAARMLGALVEHELAERDRRRIERHLAQARLLPGKTLESFDPTFPKQLCVVRRLPVFVGVLNADGGVSYTIIDFASILHRF